MARKAELADRVVAITQAAEQMGVLSVPRHFTEVEGMVGPGTEQVAKLTILARSHEWAFSQVMEALTFLEKLEAKHWSQLFLIAHPLEGDNQGRPHFSWRKSPTRRYENFHDFYQQELQQTFGQWSDLETLWQRRMAGEINDDEAKRQIELGKHGGARTKGEQGDNITLKERGTSRAYTLARLDRDDHAELAAQVRAGALSANAAAIEAGYRRQKTALDRLRKDWKEATEEERRAFLKEISP